MYKKVITIICIATIYSRDTSHFLHFGQGIEDVFQAHLTDTVVLNAVFLHLLDALHYTEVVGPRTVDFLQVEYQLRGSDIISK